MSRQCPYEFVKNSIGFEQLVDHLRERENSGIRATSDENAIAELVARIIDEADGI